MSAFPAAVGIHDAPLCADVGQAAEESGVAGTLHPTLVALRPLAGVCHVAIVHGVDSPTSYTTPTRHLPTAGCSRGSRTGGGHMLCATAEEVRVRRVRHGMVIFLLGLRLRRHYDVRRQYAVPMSSRHRRRHCPGCARVVVTWSSTREASTREASTREASTPEASTREASTLGTSPSGSSEKRRPMTTTC